VLSEPAFPAGFLLYDLPFDRFFSFFYKKIRKHSRPSPTCSATPVLRNFSVVESFNEVEGYVVGRQGERIIISGFSKKHFRANANFLKTQQNLG